MIIPRLFGLLFALGLVLSGGCSVKRMAMNQVSDTLAGGSGVFATDDDPELIGDALPFSLKLMESVLQSTPEHVGLLASLASGFAQYSYGWTQLEADFVEEANYDRAAELRGRSVKLYQRARDYGFRGLEVKFPGFATQLRSDPAAALARLDADDVELLYWTALPWAGAIALSLDDPELVSDLAFAEAMMERALALDPDWGDGAIHGFFVTYEMSRMNSAGDPAELAGEHYRRALELTGGQKASVFVGYAEAVSAAAQDKEQFVQLLERALAIDVDARPDWRLENLLYQSRARWLLERMDWLFL